MGTEKSSWSIVMVGSGVGWGRVGWGGVGWGGARKTAGLVGAQYSLNRAVHRWGEAGQALPVTAPSVSFSEAASHGQQSSGTAPGMT